MSWYIDYKVAKIESEAVIDLEIRIENFKTLLQSQPWTKEQEQEIRAVISRLQTQLTVLRNQAA